MAPVLFVDLDGTVRAGYDELGRFVNGPDDVLVFGEAVERMRAWRAEGGRVVAVTNQAGVAIGYMSSEDNAMAERETVRQADGQIDVVLTCTHAPAQGCFCRKPEPGLIYQGWLRVEAMWSTPFRDECRMVGDRPEDREAAARAGIAFIDAVQWRAGDG